MYQEQEPEEVVMTLPSIATSLSDKYGPLTEQVKQNPYPYHAKLRHSELVLCLPHMVTCAVTSYGDFVFSRLELLGPNFDDEEWLGSLTLVDDDRTVRNFAP